MSHALVLQIVVPLLSAPLCLLLRGGAAAAAVAVAVGAFCLGNAVHLLRSVLDGGVLQYQLGGFPPPIGIEYRLDLLNAYVLVVVAGIGAVTTAWAAVAARHELGGARRDLFFALWQLCVTGMMGIVVTGDAFNVFVFLEISSLSGYALIAHGAERRALIASFRYLLMGTVGATFVLIGIGLLYMMTGTLNLQDLAARLPEVAATRPVRAAWAFISVGLCLKAAVFPLHLWLPSAYACAPASVSALLAGTATKVAVYLWMRFFFTTFSPAEPFAHMPVAGVLLGLGLAGAVVASLVAVFQDEPKRLLAWSSIAQVGYMVVGLGLASEAGLTAAVAHLLNHAVAKTAAFLALGVVALRLGTRGRALRMRDLHGLFRTMPGTASALTIAGLGLIGMPFTAGFVTKWLLIEALLEQGLWWAAGLVLVSSLLAVIYVWRLIEAMFLQVPDGAPEPGGVRVGLLLSWPVWTLAAATLVLGLWGRGGAEIAREAVARLLGGAG